MIRVYLNPGPQKSKRPWPAVTVGKVNSPEDAVFVDLDNDGAVDVVSCCEGRTRTVYFHWAPANAAHYQDPAKWSTAAVPATQDRQMWMFALPLDIDGRNGIDLVVGSKGAATIGWLQSPKDPRNAAGWSFHPLYKAGWIMSLQAHDMDGDGDLDILASDRKGPTRGVLWLENPGQAEAAKGADWPVHRIGAENREVMFLARANLTGGSSADVVFAARGAGFGLLTPAASKAGRWRYHEIAMPPGCGTGKGVAVGDINGDGRPDIVFSCENASGGKSGVRWLRYSKSPLDERWLDEEISGEVGVKFDRIELLDLDGDGDLDVLTCEERDNLGVIWYENPHR